MYIENLYLYPIKGCAGISVQRMDLTTQGPTFDRIFVLCDMSGKFLSQRAHPQMAKIRTSLAGTELQVQMDGHSPHAISLDEGETVTHPQFRKVEVTIHNDPCAGIDLGDAHADWFSAAVGQGCRLIRQVKRLPRMRKSDAVGGMIEVSFADGYPLLMVSEASVQELNQRLRAEGSEPVTHHRFRPNIVLGGTDPYAEDFMNTVGVRDATFTAVKQCPRCVVINTDQMSGERKLKGAPLTALAKYRRGPKGVMLGMYCLVDEPGEIAVNDRVQSLTP